MATYDIAPANTGSEIGMAEMKYGLVNKEDYNSLNAVTTEINMQTLVVNSTTYQSDLTSKTWNTSQPYGFAEMAGQTWDDVVDYVLNITALQQSNCDRYTATITRNGTTICNITKNSSSLPTISNAAPTVSEGDTIVVSVTAIAPTGVNCASFSGTDATMKTGNSSLSYTTRLVVSSLNTQTYTFTADATDFKAISLQGVATL